MPDFESGAFNRALPPLRGLSYFISDVYRNVLTAQALPPQIDPGDSSLPAKVSPLQTTNGGILGGPSA
jgi:hypothetical protein